MVGYSLNFIYPNPDPNPMKRNQPMQGDKPFVSYTVCVNHFLEYVVLSGQAVVTGVVPSPPPVLAFYICIARGVFFVFQNTCYGRGVHAIFFLTLLTA